MFVDLSKIIKRRNFLTYRNEGILVCKANGESEGVDLAEEILENSVDGNTVLYLSGGSTPMGLYKRLAKTGTSLHPVLPGAVAMVDERYGEKWHKNSNERMMGETGLLGYLETRGIQFCPILASATSGESIRPLPRSPQARVDAAGRYDARLRMLQSTYRRHVGVLGLGEDGHTAGLPAGSQKSNFIKSKFKSQKSIAQVKSQNLKEVFDTNNFVIEYDDGGGRYGERVTMSFLGLSMMDLMLVLVFGKKKKWALERMFEVGSEEEIPGRFFKRKEIAGKVVLITDVEF